MNHIFGPVPSRRLGRSLGIDVIPPKTCSFDCLYCESGRTTRLTCRRQSFVDPGVVLEQLDSFLREHPNAIDALTFSAAGEPTLYAPLGSLIAAIKKRHPAIPLVVISNGSLFWDPEVRRDLMAADLVIPSLDAAVPSIFKELNRPHPRLELAEIIEGLEAFRRDYRGSLTLEVLLVKGVNDGPQHLPELRRVIDRVAPDRVELNTVVRPPAVEGVSGLDRAEMERAMLHFAASCTRIIGSFSGTAPEQTDQSSAARVVQMVERRPCTEQEMAVSLAISAEQLAATLKELERRRTVIRRRFGDRVYICLPDREEISPTDRQEPVQS